MKIIDSKFKDNKTQFILQSLMATGAIFIILLLLDAVSNAAVIASLGASSFIAFTMPHANVSKPRYLIGGYIIGIFVGCCCYLLSTMSFIENIPFLLKYSNVIFCSIAVGLAVFLMVITNTEHPPATGMALGLFLNQCEMRTIIVALAGVLCLVVLKTLLKPYLKDLL